MKPKTNEKATNSPDFDPTQNEPVPPAVAAAAAKADELIRSGGKTVEPAAPPEQPPAEPQPQPPEPPKEEPPSPSDDDPVAKLEHKVKVLQGKLDAEVPRLTNELKRAYQLIERQRAMIEQASAAAPAAPAAPDFEPLDAEKFSAYGPDFVQVIEAINAIGARGGGGGEQIRQIVGQVENLTKQVGSVTFEQFAGQVFGAVAGGAGISQQEVKALNDDPQFLDWLNEEDELTGRPRLELLHGAQRDRDVNRAARFFTRYLSEKRPKDPVPERKGPLDNQALPPTGGAGPTRRDSAASEIETLRKKAMRAEQDFVRGRITEAQYDTVMNQYQTAIRSARA